MKKRHWLGIAIILAFLTYSAITFSNSLTPYVTFAQAREAGGSVQVRGILADDRVAVADDGKMIQFKMRDEAGEEVMVVYNGVKPDGLEQATSIVAVGTYQHGRFAAERLLVKCPSKYRGSGKR